ncbi:tripartite tricarboxylate transporter TctB family protein [Gynuella sp.]|uniref:tripartite tricarboxylate transporter TctB family protein n=1 Tax=Gynuella sp. TaxID=2969146 RepID=UPI003D0A9A28
MSFINDRVFGLLMFILAVAYGWGALQFPEPFGGAEAVGPKTFPLILSVILAITSAYLVVKPDPDLSWPLNRSGIDILIAIAILIIYTVLLEPLGFIIATTIMVTSLSRLLKAPIKNAFLTGLIGSVVIFVLFNYGLELTLPHGLLELR